jgi:hypothetical protein
MRELGIGRLVLLCAALLLPTRSGAESDFSRLNTQGEQAYQNGQFGDAANLLQQAYAIKPVPALLFNIARAYERMGNDEQAIRFYQRYLDAQGTDAETVKKAARALDLLRSRAAEKEIEQAKAAQEKAAQEKAAQAKAVEEKAAAEKAAQEKAAREPTAPAKAPAPPVAVVASPPPAPRPSLVPWWPPWRASGWASRRTTRPTPSTRPSTRSSARPGGRARSTWPTRPTPAMRAGSWPAGWASSCWFGR